MSKVNFENINTFFVDLDGTLVDGLHHTQISKKNINAYIKAAENNNMIVSTGRLPISAKPFLDVLPMNYAITGNGSVILDQNHKVIFEKKIDYELAKELSTYFLDNKFGVKLNAEQTYITKKMRIIHKLLEFAFPFRREKDIENYIKHPVYKIVVWGHREKKISKYIDILAKKYPQLSFVASSGGWTIEVTDIDATKGKAAEWLIKNVLKKKCTGTAHLGDSMNDSTTKGKVDILIAMSNSQKELLKMADYTGPNYKNGGVADLLKSINKI